MAGLDVLRSRLVELVIVFVGVALAFAVENLREDINERAVGAQYLNGFRDDLTADAQMLAAQIADRTAQLRDAKVALEYFEDRPLDASAFLAAYYAVLPARGLAPSRNTMDEVLNAGGLRLIRDPVLRRDLLDLYATYRTIAEHEAHISRDFDAYLYDPTFTSVPIDVIGPWEDTDDNRRIAETIISNLTIANGIRLVVANLEGPDVGLIAQLDGAQARVEALLARLPSE